MRLTLPLLILLLPNVLALSVTNISPAAYQSEYLGTGDVYFVDRAFTISALPIELEGSLWVRTANDDKTSTVDPFLSFLVDERVHVLVGIDVRHSPPAWMADWSSAGTVLTTSDTQYDLYEKRLSAGNISLGPNAGNAGTSMYVVLVRRALRGDVTGDGLVDVLDLSLVASDYHAVSFDPRADCNGDGWVDLFDLVIVGVDFTYPDKIPPSAVSSLTASVDSDSRINLSWGMATDDTGVEGYVLSRDSVLIANISSFSFTDSGLSPLTTYEYSVRAYDFAGNLGPVAITSATTAPAVASPTAEVWARHEVRLSGSSTGNPFEVVLDGEFTHSSSGERIVMPGYYGGSGEWAINFMPTRPGEWTYVTTASEPSLAGVTGSIEAIESGRRSLLEASLDRWRFRDQEYVTPLALRMEFFSEPATLVEFTAAADFLAANEAHLLETRLLEENGMFGGRHDFIFSGAWTDHVFDNAIWDRMEARMDVLAERGLGAHIMFYSDDAGTPGWSGQSPTEDLVLRYAIARLAAYPSVVWNTGIDIAEYRTEADVDWFGARLASLDPYGHPRSSRLGGGSGLFIMDDENFRSDGMRTASSTAMLATAEAVSLPVSFDDAFGENRPSHPSKDHHPEDIRRAAWKALMAEGSGMLIRGGGDGLPFSGFYSLHAVESDWESEQWLRLVAPFVKDRLGAEFPSLRVETGLVSGAGVSAVADADRDVILIHSIGAFDRYDAGGSQFDVLLSSEAGTWDGTWFDPRTGVESPAGTFSGGTDYSVSAPSADDWILLLE